MKDWVEIISFTYPLEANLAKSYIEASGIEVIVKDELTVQTYNFISNAIGGIKIFVPKDKAKEALLLLEDAGYIDKNLPEKKEKIESIVCDNVNLCPYCNSTNIVRKRMPGYTFAISIILLGYPLPFVKRRYYCFDCSKKWKVKRK